MNRRFRNQVANVNEHVSNVLNAQDKTLLIEAAVCFSNRALRAAYIMCWISIAESLKRKLDEAAVLDAEIGKTIRKLRECEERQKPTDFLLLDRSIFHEIVEAQYKPRLEHILKMRGLYAHPLNSAPSPEETLAAFSIAVESVLGVETRLGKGHVQMLIERLSTDVHLLEDDLASIQQYAEFEFHRIKESAHLYVLDRLAEKASKYTIDIFRSVLRRRLVAFGQHFTSIMSAESLACNSDIDSLLNKHGEAAAFILITDRTLPKFSAPIQDRMISLVSRKDDFNKITPSPSGLSLLLGLRACGLLRDPWPQRLSDYINQLTSSQLAQSNVPITEAARRIIQDLRTRNWYVQNPAIDAVLHYGPKEFEKLDNQILLELGRNIYQAADGESKEAVSFIIGETNKGLKWPPSLAVGLLGEAFTDGRGKLRPKTKQLTQALKFAFEYTNGDPSWVFTEVTKLVSECVKGYPGTATLSEACSTIKEFSAKPAYTTKRASLDSLATEVTQKAISLAQSAK